MNRRALTIVEMLVSLACVVMLMLAYTQLFSDVGGRIGDARSMIELEDRMRGAAHRLRTDLAGHTCDLLPPQNPANGAGYFEYVEGGIADRNQTIPDDSSTAEDESLFLGDYDDFLFFTIRSKEGPFTGQYNGQTVQSEVAEVAWFLRPTMKSDGVSFTTPPTYTLYRKIFLVMPTYAGSPLTVPAASYTGNEYKYDISLRKEGTNYVGNTLGDLAKRENRFAHDPDVTHFPNVLLPQLLVPFGGKTNPSYQIDSTMPSYVRYGEDVVLTNVVAFDVQAWDPKAPVYVQNGVAIGPSDPGFTTALTGTPPTATQPTTQGAWVNLNWFDKDWNTGAASPLQWSSGLNLNPFFTRGHPKSKLTANFHPTAPAVPTSATYDTWSTSYEHDGINQNGGAADQSTDGFQDDVNSTDTSPPYPVPLRGIKITIRCYEPDARQFHQVSVVQSFVPE